VNASRRLRNRAFADVPAARLRRRTLLVGAATGPPATAACAPLVGDRARGGRIGREVAPVRGFHSQAEWLVNTRRAAHLVGAARMDRPSPIRSPVRSTR
jgi:secreted PhoX family phosphatase